jgi:type II secretory pathway component PulF
MALYFYQAFTKNGKKISGHLDAASMQEVKDRLTQQGSYPIKVEITREGMQGGFFSRLLQGSVKTKEKILFTKQLAVLLKSGIPLLQALELLIDQFKGALRTIVVAVKDDIKEGSSLADALKKYPKTFDNIYVQLVRAGEASGKLEMILERLTLFLERKEEMRGRVVSALRYPLIQLAFAVLVVMVMLIYVVPNMVENFTQSGKELPGATKLLIAISNFFVHYYLVLIIGTVIITVAYKYWSATSSGARFIDQLKLRLPLVRFFARTGAVVQFSQTLGMLMESGVNLSEALDIVVQIVNNRILKDTLNEARDKIIKQGKIAQYLKETNLFPTIAIHLIKTGEESGQLDFMLLTIAQNYEEDLKEAADNLATYMNPILLIFMAVVVGFIVISIALPIMQMSDSF